MELLDTHRRLLERWRDAMNLVGPGPLEEHYEDCASALRGPPPTGRWADLGSGAGFPGIPLAATFPELTVRLVDSRKKRCAFLRQVLSEAGMPATRVDVICARVEDLESGVWDGITARAFAPPTEVLGHAARLLVPGGTALLMLQQDQALPEVDGFEVFHVEHYTVHGRARRSVRLRRQA
ncbi:MAG: 16S rRNA (guanine(527)-N(7))-methyltransferase RsmG [Alphaproteobacteria bacterium]|nr:16S rRNA (guanine(527)-N(7))-methyltransferase RsmG [Alphaproteobacteria bacterium]